MVRTPIDEGRSVWTEAQLMSLPDVGHKCEVVGGKLVMTPAGFEHGDICTRISARLAIHVWKTKLGRVFDSSTGFWMKSGNLRSPDISFVAARRLKGLKRLPEGFFRGSPDLAVEVLSPSDTVESVHDRIIEYFANDTRRAWLVSPVEKTVLVYHPSGPDRILKVGDSVDGEEVVPGFSLPLSEIFADLDLE
jgi:Uma2 family endonuclease